MNSPLYGIALRSRFHACWLGKSIGGTLGLPAEGKMERLDFNFYNPIPTAAPPNDDLELQLVWLQVVENAGATLIQADFARAWLENIHYMWDEYGRCRWNLRRGVAIESVGTFENHFHDAMGSPIRSEIWACFFAGDPDSAAHYAALDASLDHGLEGIAGEVFFAVMQSHIAAGGNVESAISLAKRYIPAESKTAKALELIQFNYRNGIAVWDCRQKFLDEYNNENFTDAPLNVALTLWALLYGEGDFETSILLAVNGGYDTDCTAATVGATLGFNLGVEGIPARWIKPIGEDIFVGPGIVGICTPQTLQELTNRVLAASGKLERQTWDGSIWSRPLAKVNLAHLAGTISITPIGMSHSILWANGELPDEVKQAGGAEWTWEIPTEETRLIICLARNGAKLFIDDKLVVECPSGLPYVPATHRCAEESRNFVKMGQGSHRVRLELSNAKLQQDVSVILAYTNLHICAWSADQPPHAAIL